MTIQEKALEALSYFERKTREDGTSYYCHNAPDESWIYEMVHDAHGGMMPDDHRYDMIHSALYSIANEDADPEEMYEIADGMVGVYHGEQTAWLASNSNRAEYVNYAIQERGPFDDIHDQIAAGWYLEAIEVCALVVNALESEAGND